MTGSVAIASPVSSALRAARVLSGNGEAARKGAVDDRVLVQQVLEGDERAFKRIVEEHFDAVARTVTGMLGASAEVDDAVQDVFIKLHANLATFRGDASLRTFVTRMAINRSLDVLRQRKRRRWMQTWGLASELDAAGATTPATTGLEQQDLDERLREALETLPRKQRTVVVLRLIEGLSTEETARVLDIKYGTVLSRLKRATDHLREVLSANGTLEMLEENPT
ncbi:MAG: hypothetical protein COV99_05020 [Bacteroidetes bacterium CG12_big_fil_rev_8_21_14_0_65_60_17]|nr:MAG: hypothetical protein COV99_05020 [Bacteroidetes bacterium CG12_big_fil_rev_8_21_14_0_65_60_17]